MRVGVESKPLAGELEEPGAGPPVIWFDGSLERPVDMPSCAGDHRDRIGQAEPATENGQRCAGVTQIPVGRAIAAVDVEPEAFEVQDVLPCALAGLPVGAAAVVDPHAVDQVHLEGGGLGLLVGPPPGVMPVLVPFGRDAAPPLVRPDRLPEIERAEEFSRPFRPF